MDSPYGSNVVEGTVYINFYQTLANINSLIKEKNQEKRGKDLVSLIQKNFKTIMDFGI